MFRTVRQACRVRHCRDVHDQRAAAETVLDQTPQPPTVTSFEVESALQHSLMLPQLLLLLLLLLFLVFV